MANIKVVFLGSMAVGKSCLIKRYVDGFFCEMKHIPTIGAAYVNKAVIRGKRKLVFHLWAVGLNKEGERQSVTAKDTAGQERYLSMTKLYYRGAHVAIVCYDMTDPNSFQRLRFWVDELTSFAENCKIYICGTKKDLINDVRIINPGAVTHFADSIKARSIETSSKTGENVDELFEIITTDIFETDLVSSLENKTNDKIDLHNPKPRRCCHR